MGVGRTSKAAPVAVRRYSGAGRRSRVSPWKNPCHSHRVPAEVHVSVKRHGWMRWQLKRGGCHCCCCCSCCASRPSHYALARQGRKLRAYDAEVASALDAGLNGLPATWDGQPALRLPCILDSRGESARHSGYCMRTAVHTVYGGPACMGPLTNPSTPRRPGW